MSHLTPEQEQQIIDEVTALDWIRPPSDFYRRSAQVIREHVGCSTEDADLLLRQLEEKKLIESVSESGGQPADGRTMDSYGWKWIRKTRM
jgi:hypothetical protein